MLARILRITKQGNKGLRIREGFKDYKSEQKGFEIRAA